MDIHIEWQEPIQLTHNKNIIIADDALPEAIKDGAGVYFFSRKYAENYEPFYIGETMKLKRRLGQHLKTKKMAFVLMSIEDGEDEIKKGERYFHFGYLKSKPGQDARKCIRAVQKYLVRDALASKIKLLNVRLVTFKTHTITFDGSKKARGFTEKR